MNKLNLKINYLYNSSFTVESEKYILIFDYFEDNVDSGEKTIRNGAIGKEDLKTDKNILVFSSHSHSDHFNPIILDWAKLRPDINYILSSDIKLSTRTENIHIMSPYEEIEIENIHIKTYGSTDLGVSFLVYIDDVCIFHAGDLNWWYWMNDPIEQIEEAENLFKDEIDRIDAKNIDLVFFPVDPRLQNKFYYGGKYFIEKFKPNVFIPMHFGENYQITKDFKEAVKSYSTSVVEISSRGQEIIV